MSRTSLLVVLLCLAAGVGAAYLWSRDSAPAPVDRGAASPVGWPVGDPAVPAGPADASTVVGSPAAAAPAAAANPAAPSPSTSPSPSRAPAGAPAKPLDPAD